MPAAQICGLAGCFFGKHWVHFWCNVESRGSCRRYFFTLALRALTLRECIFIIYVHKHKHDTKGCIKHLNCVRPFGSKDLLCG